MLKARRLLTFQVLAIMSITGCSVMAPQPVREVNYTLQKLGTPAVVVSEAGKPQVVRVMVPDQAGNLVPGKLDSAGMMLIDMPTYELYRAAWRQLKQGAKESPAATEPKEPKLPPPDVPKTSL